MAEGRMKEAWLHTSALLAGITNLFAKSPVSPDKFNPFSESNKAKVQDKGMSEENYRKWLYSMKPPGG